MHTSVAKAVELLYVVKHYKLQKLISSILSTAMGSSSLHVKNRKKRSDGKYAYATGILVQACANPYALGSFYRMGK